MIAKEFVGIVGLTTCLLQATHSNPQDQQKQRNKGALDEIREHLSSINDQRSELSTRLQAIVLDAGAPPVKETLTLLIERLE